MANIKTSNIEGIKVDKTGREYVSNPFLLAEIIKSKEKGELTSNALQMLLLMIENIQRKRYYKTPEEKEDCASSAIYDVLMYWQNFNPEKSTNPFAFYTSVITNGLAKGWDKLHPENKKCPGARFTSLDNNIHSF